MKDTSTNEISKTKGSEKSIEDISNALLLSSSNKLDQVNKSELIITKSHNHDHFWVDGGILYESYNTLRGRRYRQILEVPNLKDSDRLSDQEIKSFGIKIENEF